MLYWTKYYLCEKIDENKIILWNTRTGQGFVLKGNLSEIIESSDNKIWRENIDPNIKKLLIENEFLLNSEQILSESNLVERMRIESVFNDTFLSLTIVPTDMCNFNCIYCYQSETVHKMSYSTADSIVRMIEKAKFLKKLHISWFGGEPLCNKSLVVYLMQKINEVCKKNHIVLISDMTTNGSLLDLDTFKELYSLKVLNYQITIDGCKKTHDIQRPLKTGESSYDMILNNLRNIRDNFKGKLFKIGIRTNFTEFVDTSFLEMKEELEKEFSNDPRFYFFFQWVKNWGGERIDRIVTKLLNDTEAVEHYGRWMDVMADTNVRTGDITLIRPCSGLCVGCLKNGYLINTDGTLCKCTTGIYDEEYKDKATIGYIDENGNRIINKWNEIDWISKGTDEKECNECSLYPICLGMPCPYYKIKFKKAVCNKETDYIRTILRALEKQRYFTEYDCR